MWMDVCKRIFGQPIFGVSIVSNVIVEKRQTPSGKVFALVRNGQTFGVFKQRSHFDSGRHTPFWSVVQERLSEQEARELLAERAGSASQLSAKS